VTNAAGRLPTRLAAAFVLVALAAVALLATLTLLATRHEVSRLAESQRTDLASAVAQALAAEYRKAGSWSATDLGPALAVAASDGALATVVDEAGGVVGASEGAPGLAGPQGQARGRGAPSGSPVSAPVEVGGAEVGSVVVRFPGSGLSRGASEVRSALFDVVLLGAALSVLLAVGVAIVLSRRITRPVAELGAAVRRLERGELDARANLARAPGEIRDLGRAFDSMAETIETENDLRRALVADVAHELRTPVTILQAECEALMDGVEAPSPDRLASLHEEVVRLGRLVGDLETLSAAEAARLGLSREPVDLAEVAGRSADRLAPYFEAAELTLVRRLTPAAVSGDPPRLGQVVDNLLGNALKFTPPGGGVAVEVWSEADTAALRVSDTGPGIPDAELPHLFERFWRGEEARGVAGSGIGLAVVAELVRAHGGRVDVASENGATFTVHLPRAPGASAVCGAGAAAPRAGAEPARTRRPARATPP
jgi:two-component system sensor histidine kinase BaeS